MRVPGCPYRRRDKIFDEMSVQAQAVEKQRRLTEGFEVTCYPVYEQDWVPFKVSRVLKSLGFVIVRSVSEVWQCGVAACVATR